MKRFLCFALALAMLMAFAACGSSNTSPAENNQASSSESQPREDANTNPPAEEPGNSDAAGESDVPQKPDNWPTDTVTIVLPVSAGGGNDLFCRVMADYLNKQTGGTFVVVNDTSGGGLAAYETVRNAKPDGYTFLCYNTSALVRQYTGMYEHDLLTEFEMVGPTYSSLDGYVIAARTDLPYSDWEGFVEYAEANPGAVRKGVENRGIPHLQSVLIEDALGIETKMMETTGGDPDKLAALLGNIVDIAVMSSNQVSAYVESGELTVLLSCSLERSEAMPQFPCLTDVGLENTLVDAYGFMAAPLGTDPQIIAYLNYLQSGMETDPECAGAFSQMNYYYEHLSPQDFYNKFANSAALISNACELIG